jgi:hypothetical protein
MKKTKAKKVVWNPTKQKAPKGEVVRIFPAYAKLNNKRKIAVMVKL